MNPFKLFRDQTVAVKINIVLFVSFILLIAFIVILTGSSIRSLALDSSERRVAEEAQSISARFSEVTEIFSSHVEHTANVPGLAQAIAAGNTIDAEAILRANAHPDDFSLVEAVALDGRVITRVLWDMDLLDNLDRGAVVEAALAGSPAIRLIPAVEQGGRIALWMVVAYPTVDDDGQVVGAVLGGREFDTELLREINAERDNVHIALVREGQVLAHDLPLDADEEGAAGGEEEPSSDINDFAFDSEGNTVIIREGQAVNPGDSLMRGNPDEFFVIAIDPEAVAQAAQGRTVIGAEINYGVVGVPPTRAAYTPLIIGGDSSTVIAVLFRLDDLFQFQREFTSNTSRIFAFMALLTILIAAFIAQQTITTPLRRLERVAQRMTEGDYRERAVVESSDEVGRLAAAFNAVADTVQRREGDLHQLASSLERQVQQRTAELVEQAESLRQTNRELEAARRIAEEAARLKSEFLATVSHELRTPLNAMIGFSEIMLSGMGGELDDDARHMTERILANSQRLLALINDVLDLSKIEAQRIEVAPTPFSPRQFAEDLRSQNASLADRKGLALEVEIDPALPPQILGDTTLLARIGANLLSNAIKFTEAGSVRLRLEQATPERWRLAVQDTGIGIPPHALNFIFDPFRQLDGSSQRAYSGTGLGLTIVRELAMAMGGQVSVESRVGGGSTFTVTLPLSVPAPELA